MASIGHRSNRRGRGPTALHFGLLPIGGPAQIIFSLRSIAAGLGTLRLSALIPLDVHPVTPCGVRR
jgi:hypothetical protein